MPKSRTEVSTPRLSEYARSFVYPDGITKTVWPRVEAKGEELGLGFDWWQSQLGTVCLGYGDDGKYVSTIGGIGLSIPRQVGKTYFVLALLVIMCILFPGLQVVWTAHHLRTSTKTFTHLRGICRRKKVAPHIRALRAANGEQQAEFANGSMIMFGSRARGFGRGFDEVDVEVFDEAQILDTKSLEDMIAATNQARHEHGALLFFMGTPPRLSDPSDAFTLRRKQARSGASENAVWLEISADPKSHPDDRRQFPLMNPSYPKRTPLESMLRLRQNLGDDDSWNHEGRGIWDEDDAVRPVSLTEWADLLVAADPPTRACLVVDVAPNRRRWSIGVAADYSDGRTLLLVKTGANIADVVPALVKLDAEQNIVEIALDERGQAGALIPDIEAAGLAYEKLNTTQMGQACAAFQTGVPEKRYAHVGQTELSDAIAGLTTRFSGEVELWDRRDKDRSIDISPVVAVSTAAYRWAKHAGLDYDPLDSIG